MGGVGLNGGLVKYDIVMLSFLPSIFQNTTNKLNKFLKCKLNNLKKLRLLSRETSMLVFYLFICNIWTFHSHKIFGCVPGGTGKAEG